MKGCTALFLLFVIGFVSAQCTYNSSNGDMYDLSSLTIPATAPLSEFYYYNDTGNDAAGNYLVNVCGPLNATYCEEGTAVCQIAFSGTEYSCGMADSLQMADYQGENSTENQGVTLVYSNGTPCPGQGISRMTSLNIGCRPGSQPNITSVSESTPCVYVIQMYADQGCALVENSTMSATPSSSPSPVPSSSSTPSNTPSATNMNATATTTTTPTATMTATATNTTTPTANMTATATNTTTPTANMTATATNTTTPTTNMTATVSNTTSPAGSCNPNATSCTVTPAPSASTSGGNDSWIWWVLAASVVVVLIIAACIAGFVIWKKKQSAGYNEFDIEYD